MEGRETQSFQSEDSSEVLEGGKEREGEGGGRIERGRRKGEEEGRDKGRG